VLAPIAVPPRPVAPVAGPRRVLVAVRGDAALAAAIARLAERADVEIAIAAPGLPGGALDAHENVAVIEGDRLGAALASSHLLIADAPAARAAAAALGVPTVDPGAPAAVLRHAERVLDGGVVPAPIRLAA
jgi:hypothetical protein